MDVRKLKLHSNYLHPNCSVGMKNEGRINKLHPNSSFNSVSMNIPDMCIVDNKNFKKTIETDMSNGLSFKGRYDKLYKFARAIVDEDMPNRAWYLARKSRFDKMAKTVQKNNPFLYKVVTNEKFLRSMKFINDNALLSDAGIALFYTCLMRPLSLAALPTKDNNEKKKNIYQMGHSISTGIIGFLTAFAIQTPIKDAITKISNAVNEKQAGKYIKTASEELFKRKNIEKTRTILERSHQPISLPLKAALTIFLVPRILKLFGLTKQTAPQNEQKGKLPYDAFQYFASFRGKEPSAFKNFKTMSGGVINASK